MNLENNVQRDYVQRLFEDQFAREHHFGKAARVIPWALATIGVLSLAAYALRDYWYPYIEQYLYR